MKYFAIPLGAGLLFCALLMTSQARTVGSGKMVTENRAVSGFHGVDLVASAELTIMQGESESLTVEAEENIAPLLESVVENGILHLRFKEHNVTTTRPVALRLTARSLDALTLAGSGSIRADHLKAPATADLRLPGSGTITVEHLETPTLHCSLDGSGTVKLSGTASRQQLRIDGSGEFDGAGLQGDSAEVIVNGSGRVSINVSKELDVQINGSGEVRYHGTPEVAKKINGSGEVRAAR